MDDKNGYKRVFDLILLFMAHILFFPVWLCLWLLIPFAILLETGRPIFYRQVRPAGNDREFVLFKFRTMIFGADIKGPAWTKEGDSRLTIVGKFLRKTALDELPQLFNIYKGDMSFVGPRPYPLKEEQELESKIPEFKKRLLLKPGLTSMGEVYDATDDPYLTLRYDLEYLGRMSPFLDMKLLLLSVGNSIFRKWDKRSGKEKFYARQITN